MAKKIKLKLYEGDIVDGYEYNEFIAIYKNSRSNWIAVHRPTLSTLQGKAIFKKKADCLKYVKHLAESLNLDFDKPEKFLELNNKSKVIEIQKEAMENV